MQPTLQDNQLMSKHRVLSFKPHPRLEWRGQDGQNETEQSDHSVSLGDSITSSTRIRFSVHTTLIVVTHHRSARRKVLGKGNPRARFCADSGLTMVLDPKRQARLEGSTADRELSFAVACALVYLLRQLIELNPAVVLPYYRHGTSLKTRCTTLVPMPC